MSVPNQKRLPDNLVELAKELTEELAAHSNGPLEPGHPVYESVFFGSDGCGKAVAEDEAGNEWTLESGTWPKLEIVWPWQIRLTRDEIEKIASGSLTAIDVAECRSPHCPIVLRSSESFCWAHSDADPAGPSDVYSSGAPPKDS